MILGVIGVGCVGGTLAKWLLDNTNHKLRLLDPAKGYYDSLEGCDVIFVSVPVPDNESGQDQSTLTECVRLAKEHTNMVFIRSTVLPGTNDKLNTIAMPEFLTERHAYEDMCKYPVLCGKAEMEFVERIFPNKKIMMMKNVECELAKLSHNCFGAMKVTYMNLIYQLAEKMGANYEAVKAGYSITGFIEDQHTNIAQDGKLGYAGSCFPTNVKAMIGFLNDSKDEQLFFRTIDLLNTKYRSGEK